MEQHTGARTRSLLLGKQTFRQVELMLHMAPPVGLEPTTCRLTVCRATYCAKEAYTRHILDCKIGIEPITFSWKENVLPLDYLQSKSLLNVSLCNPTYFAFYLFTALPTASHISLGGHNR